MNKVELHGRVDRLTVTRVGDKNKTTFTVIIKKVFNNREFTDYVPVEIWKSLNGLNNGDEVRVEGSFTTQSWDNPNGGKSYKSFINGYKVYLLTPVGENGYSRQEPVFSNESSYKNDGDGGSRFEYGGDASAEDIF